MFLTSCFSTRSVIDDNFLVDDSSYSIEGNYSITFYFPQPYGEMYADLEIYFEDNDIKSKVYWFDGEEYILIKINKTELIDNTVFIDLVDQEVGNVEMEVYFVDAKSISGFYAGQFRFKGERIK